MKKSLKKTGIFCLLGAFGNDFFGRTLSVYFINFITTNLVNTGNTEQDQFLITTITLIVAIIRTLEIFVDPFIGNIIDNTQNKLGQKCPWIIIGGIISGVVIAILFTNLGGLIRTNPFLYLFIFTLLFIILDLAFSFRDIGFWSLLPALTLDQEKRAKILSFTEVGAFFGNCIVAMIVMPIVLSLSLTNKDSIGDLNGWLAYGLIVCIVMIASSLFVGLGVKEKSKTLNKENTKKHGRIKDIVKTIKSNDQLLWIVFAYFLYSIASTIVMSFALYYFQYILENTQLYSMVIAICMLGGFLTIFSYSFLIKKFKRKTLLYIFLSIKIFGILVFLISFENEILAVIGATLFIVPQTIIFMMIISLFSDCVDYGQYINKKRDESLTFSARVICDKLSNAITNGIVGQTVIASGMISGATRSSLTTENIMFFNTVSFVIPTICIILSLFVFVKKIKLDEKFHKKIVRHIKKEDNYQLNEKNED